ncbi:flagellar motor switch protein FliM [Bacillus sp. FJAT-27251]|uniref:flagellar motor switch protein FliM n=1 Tax=Bacillus sp. FJAT-27251 TaxID=1684142 RepID=UPI000A5374D2|nr:flagellar motor switch protein FliM [Bacillus sp. FJAT-27251]
MLVNLQSGHDGPLPASAGKRTGAGKGRKIKTYDFKNAMRFSQEQIRTLSRIHENCARLLTSYFSTQLRTFVQISVSEVVQYSYEEFIAKVEKSSILGVFKAPPLQGSMVMAIPPNIAYLMLDRLLGGQGRVSMLNSNLTDIETAVIQRVFTRALSSFQEAWSSVEKLSPELTELEVNPQFLTMVPPNETVIVVSLHSIIGDAAGTIHICLPHVALEEVLPKLSARHWLATQKKAMASHEAEAMEKKLKGTKLDVKAILGRSTIDISEFLQLKTDDVIRLDGNYHDPLTVLVDNKRKFLAQPGISKGRSAVQVTHVMEEGDDFE